MEARNLLENPLLREAFEAVEVDLIGQMRRAKLDDTGGHTRLVMALQIANAVRGHLWQLMHDGVTASEEIRLRGKRID